MKIFTETHPDFKFRNWDPSTFTDLVDPAIFLIHTDSYSVSEVSSFQKLLPAQEQEKAQRFRFIKDQHSYILTHALLRKILGNYLNSEPAEIEFISNQYGKPLLADRYQKIHFNLSHSSGISALVFSTKSEIGVDIEKIDSKFDFDLIAKAHFSDTENRFIETDHSESCKRFYTIWTRKEALLKAIGTGIGENLDVEVYRDVNHWKPEILFQEIPDKDYYLYSFEFQDNFMITTAGCRQEENCIFTIIDVNQ